MKSYRLFVALVAAAISANASAQTVQGSVDEGFTIKAGNVTMTVSAKEGGKIMSYKYGDQEMLSQLRPANQYGSTFWTSPQKEWNWPPVTEFDRAAYTDETDAASAGKSLVLTSQVARKLPFQIQKRYTPDPKGKFINVAYTIINKGDAARQVAPWEISRVVADESALIFFDAPVEGITPAGLIPFKAEADASWYSFEQAPQNRKINSDGKGWLAYAAGNLLMIKKFDDSDERVAQVRTAVSFGAGYSSAGSFFADFAVRFQYLPNEYFTPYWYYYRENGNLYTDYSVVTPEICGQSALCNALLTLGWRF